MNKKLLLDQAEFLARENNSRARTKKEDKGYNKILEVFKTSYKAKYNINPSIDQNRFNSSIKKSLTIIEDYDFLIKLMAFFVDKYECFDFVNKAAYPRPIVGGFSVFLEKIQIEYLKHNAVPVKEPVFKEVSEEVTTPWGITFA